MFQPFCTAKNTLVELPTNGECLLAVSALHAHEQGHDVLARELVLRDILLGELPSVLPDGRGCICTPFTALAGRMGRSGCRHAGAHHPGLLATVHRGHLPFQFK